MRTKVQLPRLHPILDTPQLHTPRKHNTKPISFEVAVHQAAHAVVATLLGIAFTSVNREGLDRYDEWPLWAVRGNSSFVDESARRFISREMCCALAGPASAEYLQGHTDFIWLARDEEDWDYATEIARTLIPTPDSHSGRARQLAWVKEMWNTTCDMMYLTGVEGGMLTIARQLMQSHSLTVAEVRAIVRKRFVIPTCADEQHTPDEARWRRIEDARMMQQAQREPEKTRLVRTVAA